MNAESAELGRVALLRVDPDLGRHLNDADRIRASHQVTVPVMFVERGPVSAAELGRLGLTAFGAQIVSGVLARHISVGRRTALRFLGPGNVIHPRDVHIDGLSVEQSIVAVVPSRLAILDDHFLVAARRWPRLMTALFERVCDQNDRTLVQMAASQQTRVEERLVAVLTMLAEHWGAPAEDGTAITLDLTHEMLGCLVGARRPTVSIAVQTLAAEGRVTKTSDGRWLICGLHRSST